MAKPDLICCTRCKWVAFEPELFVNNEAYYCGSCGMDESGLEMFNRIDSASARVHDDRMITDATDAQAPRTIPERIPPDEARTARQEIRTNPDAIELAEILAEQVKAIIFPSHNDGLEDWVMEACVDELPTFRRYYMDPDSDPNDENYTKLEGNAYDLIVDIFHKELLMPMLMRLIKTGDWKSPEQE